MGELPKKEILSRFFAGLAEHTFQTHLGVADTGLVDYITELLVRSIRSDGLGDIRDRRGRPIAHLGEMLVEAENRIGPAKREVHRTIGDYTLFWAGMYPEALQKDEAPSGMFEEFCKYGKRAYHIAATIDMDNVKPPPEVLEHLSAEFEMCAYGMREVRRQWEEDGSTGPFLIN